MLHICSPIKSIKEFFKLCDFIILKESEYKGLTQPPSTSMFQLTCWGLTRGQSLKLIKRCTNKDVHLYFFSEWVINNWNKLTQTVVDSCRVDMFHKRLNKTKEKCMDPFIYWYPQGPSLERLGGSSPGTAVPVTLSGRDVKIRFFRLIIETKKNDFYSIIKF